MIKLISKLWKKEPPLKDPREYTMGGGWGDAIHWFNPEEFQKQITDKSRYKVSGHKWERPRVGDTLKAEFNKSWIWFEFVEVEYCRDPNDMFFATVKPIKQEPK